ncbi:unnamed protein product [Rhizoctonia solani]|uniref:Protein kinase domain-containing protein n=1 Tax=Rhizoctonia solani TaxID=456999 RepID=A0A8H3DHK0_9AGAM|nr:unnamed protein product [Rhizoctonia solani]
MSRIYSSPLWSGALGATNDITKFVQVSRATHDLYEEAGVGGSADIFSGKYTSPDGDVTMVAVKCIRPFSHSAGKNDKSQMDRILKKLLRELEIWRTLSGGANIIELLGIMNGIGPLPSFVCELYPWNLQDYLERKTPPPRHTKMMTDTLRGLSFMHSLESGPIAHGDIKLSNILVTSDETALICDFGRSRYPQDQPNEVIVSGSSPFAGTVRYMSPELFVPDSAKPTPAADMWAYGCVALEILCRLQPYHGISSDILISELIKSGRPPSDRPRGPRGSLINDTLWNVLSSCWEAQNWRPSARVFLEQLTRMLQSGEVPNSPIPMDVLSGFDSEPIPPWPSEIKDFDGQLGLFLQVSSSLRAIVWTATVQGAKGVAVKVPRLNASVQNQTRHDHLEYVLRKIVISRFGVRHRNIVDLMGITSGFSPHEGIVFEECFNWNLVTYFKENPVIQEEYTHRRGPMVNTYSLPKMCDILEGLKYMHSYPIPIPQGDLTPENISVDREGNAKIGLFSFGRVLAALPPSAGVTASIGSVLSSRWMSPELLVTDQQPTTESDMWAVGCVCYWILTGLKPYAAFGRDDFAGVESIRGQPPATLASVYHRYTWITNGIWGAIAKCWKQDPSLRTSAKAFSELLKALEGRKIPWLPITVVDLAGKVRLNSSQRQPNNKITEYSFVWKKFDLKEPNIIAEARVRMVLYGTTYTPKWYSKTTPVVTKAGHGYELSDADEEALVSSIHREVTLMAQINHPGIHKLLGIDSSPAHTYRPDMVFESPAHQTLDLLLNQDLLDFHKNGRILEDIASALAYIHDHINGPIAHGDIQPENIFVLLDGRAKLANFTCAFQFNSGQSTSSNRLSATITTPERPSLYRAPEYHKQDDSSELIFPNLAGDVWSFGAVMLGLFSEYFRRVNLDDYIPHLSGGKSPLNFAQVQADCESQVLSILGPILALNPQDRPSALVVLNEVSKLRS